MTDDTKRITYPHGFHPDMPLDHYYADPAPGDFGSLNSSSIPILRNRSPLHFAVRSPVLIARHDLVPADDISTAAQHRGSIVHRLALGKGCEYDVLDFPDYRTKDAQTARNEAIAAGRATILRKDFADAEAQAELLRAHLKELFFGEEYQTEVAVLWQEETPFGIVQCRALVDAWCPILRHGADLKSITDASTKKVTRKMVEMGSDIQNAWYRRGIANALGDKKPVQFSTLYGETKPPYGSQSFQLSEMWQTSAWDECQLALRLFAQCQAEDRWPTYPRSSRLLTPPGWLITQRIADELEGGIDLNDEPFEGDADND